MFIYNIKLNTTKIFKFIFSIIIILVIVLCGIVAYRLYVSSIKVNDEINNKNNLNVLTNKNYATILKAVHDNIDNYIGQKIKFDGYVYRVYDLDKNQFVLARNMIISSDMKTVVVGFLCDYENAEKLKDNTWIEIEGTICKGSYHGDMPILKINSLKEIKKPNDEYVYPPDEKYIPTSAFL